MSRGFALITVGARGGVRHCWGNHPPASLPQHRRDPAIAIAAILGSE